MKREFLEELKLDPAVIDKIMQENGKDINREKARYADYDEVKAQLDTANKTLEKFKDYDQTKADVEKYKVEAEQARQEAAAKIAQMEVQAKVKDFTGSMQFVNDFTREAINGQLLAALEKSESKGKSLEDLFKEITDGKTDILKDVNAPQPPVTTQMAGAGAQEGGVLSAFKKLNPNIKVEE